MKKLKMVDEKSEAYLSYKQAIDEVFHQIVWRNFRLFEEESDFYVFKKNPKYDDNFNFANSSDTKQVN